MPISQQTKEQVLCVLGGFAAAVSAGDKDELLRITAPDAEVCLPAGTFCGRDELIASLPRVQMVFGETTVKSEGVIAWMTGTVFLNGDSHSYAAVFRGTGKAWEVAVMQIS